MTAPTSRPLPAELFRDPFRELFRHGKEHGSVDARALHRACEHVHLPTRRVSAVLRAFADAGVRVDVVA
ncbi:RNA polymerase sigma factor, partial [Kineococcus sp. T13]|nr:RNA polymerase sigma factor [Kineococcus vitellinus]